MLFFTRLVPPWSGNSSGFSVEQYSGVSVVPVVHVVTFWWQFKWFLSGTCGDFLVAIQVVLQWINIMVSIPVVSQWIRTRRRRLRLIKIPFGIKEGPRLRVPTPLRLRPELTNQGRWVASRPGGSEQPGGLSPPFAPPCHALNPQQWLRPELKNQGRWVALQSGGSEQSAHLGSSLSSMRVTAVSHLAHCRRRRRRRRGRSRRKRRGKSGEREREREIPRHSYAVHGGVEAIILIS